MQRSNVPDEEREKLLDLGQLLGETRASSPGMDGAPDAVIRPSFYMWIWSVDAGEQRFDGAVVCGAVPVEIVGRTAPWKAGRYGIGGSARARPPSYDRGVVIPPA